MYNETEKLSFCTILSFYFLPQTDFTYENSVLKTKSHFISCHLKILRYPYFYHFY